MQEGVKNFIIRLDGQDVAQIPIQSRTTVGQIKDYFKTYLRSQGKNPTDYTIKIYRDRLNKFDVDGTDQYDGVAMGTVWNQLTDPYIVLDYSPNYFSRLYTDAIYQIALRVAISDLPNLCLADKRLSQICGDQRFWISRTIQDFGVTNKPVNMTWKEFYQRASLPDVDQLLFDSSEKGIIELVRVAVTRGANLETVRSIKHIDYTPLTIASNKGQLEVVKYLVQRGANIHAQDDLALRMASRNGQLEVVKYLVQRGANIHADGDGALILASQNGHLEVVKYLVQRGADIHAQDDLALRRASNYGHLEVVKYLQSLM